MKITYYVQRYRPHFEAISKEVKILQEYFSPENQVRVHDLHLDGLGNFKNNLEIISYHFAYYPLMIPWVRLKSKKNNINHIYTSLGDLPYLTILPAKNTILTAAASCNFPKIKKRSRFLKRLSTIVVESEKQKSDLLRLGIAEERIKIIYPPVDMNTFSYQKPPVKQKFTILYASCPTRKQDFAKRGIPLLLETAKNNKDIIIDLAWRKGAFQEINQLVNKNNLHDNVLVTNKIYTNMNERYATAHCTIIPYTVEDDFLKHIPNSALESLAAGKPLLVSEKTELAIFVKKTACGIVFSPTVSGLTEALAEIKQNYARYQQQCRKTAQEYFSKDIFLQKYQEIYHNLHTKNKVSWQR